MAIAITELNLIDGTQVATTDLIILEDISEGTTKRISFGDLTDTLLSTSAFEANASEVISALNTYNSGNDTNSLYASQLYVNGAYRTGDYFLDYDNFTNTPDIPSNLDDLTNNSGFVKLDTTQIPPRLVYLDNEGSGNPTPTYISTYNVQENTQIDDGGNLVGPLYFTNDRVEAFFDANFADYYNSFTSTFDDGNVRDSLINVAARFTDASLTAQDTQGRIMRITDTEVFDNFSAGQVIRIYGADTENGLLGGTSASARPVNSALTIAKVGFANSSTESGHQATFSYKICEFDYTNGQISPARSQKDVIIATPESLYDAEAGQFVVDNVYQAFSTDNFIRLSFTGVNAGSGLAIYRRTPETNDAFVLTAVLGPKEVADGQWIDYYNFDWAPWTGKVEEDNTYPTDVIHFPHVAPTTALRGWVDKVIESTNIIGSSKYLYLSESDSVYVSDEDVTICHNDTQKIRQAITQNASVDKKSIVLNAKTYVSGALTVPNNFGITGTSYITKIVKLPWSGAETGVSSANMVQVATASGASNISIVGVDFDGNALNQFLFPDSTDSSRNYAIDLGLSPDGPLIDKVRIRNVIGGGIYADRPVDLRVTNAEVLNSGVSDRETYSPLYAYGGEKTTITSNRFENFGLAVDVTNTDKGIVSDNLINNVGSGLTVYGSKFFISSQNVLIGPANEYLPTPDVLNSEFDMINLDLSSAYLAGGDYTSENHVYQENGQIFDLTQTAGTISNISYDAYYVEKLPNGGEQFWNPMGVNDIVFQPRSLLAYNGEFGFTIPSSVVQDIKNRTGTNSYTNLTQNTINWTLVADDIWNYATDDAPVDPDIRSFLEDVAVGYVRGDILKSGAITSADSVAVTNYSYGPGSTQYNSLSSETTFRIKKFFENAILDDYARDFPQLSDTVLTRYVNVGNPNHEGIVWRASYEHEVTCGTVNQVIEPNADNGLELWANGYYHVLVRNILPYLSVGAEVTFTDHGSTLDGQRGTVTYLNTVNNPSLGTSDTTITIKFTGESITSNDIGGNYGSINIVDKFVLAQGRIL